MSNSQKWIAISQSNYIPWKGYFDIINRVDEFVLYDTAQYTKNDWRNRNRIKTRQGCIWLTIPVRIPKHRISIQDVHTHDERWPNIHWKSLAQNYTKTPHFETYRPIFEPLYTERHTTQLSAINHQFIVAICKLLDIQTALTWSSDYTLVGDKTSRLVSICQQANATDYLTGPAARAYLDEDLFREVGISVHYMDYSHYPTYPQLFGAFEHSVSILDLLFNTGHDAPRYMKTFG